jgi:hypothetical protein
MLEIERMTLKLPAGYAGRGAAIARLVAQGLAQIDSSGTLHLPRLSLPPLHVTAQSTDREIASRVVDAIHTQIRQVQRNKGAAS